MESTSESVQSAQKSFSSKAILQNIDQIKINGSLSFCRLNYQQAHDCGTGAVNHRNFRCLSRPQIEHKRFHLLNIALVGKDLTLNFPRCLFNSEYL